MVSAEYLAFEILTLASGQFGTSELAAQSILVTITSTTYQIPFPVSIAPSKDDAAAAEAGWVAKPGYRVYTDGSDCDGGVGASAVLYRPGIAEPTVLRYRLGDSTRHSVYEAEIVGLLLAAHLLLALLSFHLASCAADNKACLLAVRNRKPHPAH